MLLLLAKVGPLLLQRLPEIDVLLLLGAEQMAPLLTALIGGGGRHMRCPLIGRLCGLLHVDRVLTNHGRCKKMSKVSYSSTLKLVAGSYKAEIGATCAVAVADGWPCSQAVVVDAVAFASVAVASRAEKDCCKFPTKKIIIIFNS